MSSTFVLVPGAGGESWYWHRVVPLLEARGHEVVSPDLPAGDDDAGQGEYADAVVEAVGDRGELVVVAQSMGAFVVPRLPERLDVRMFILVAPDVPTRVIAGRNDRLFPRDFMQRLSHDRLGVEPTVIDSGHLPALARPAELAEMLETLAR